MSTTIRHNVTHILNLATGGDQNALAQLIPVVYSELRTLAARELRGERAGHTLQATALVHEAYMRLVDQHNVRWQNRAQFFGVASQMMRRILVDHARARCAGKRAGGHNRIPLDEALAYASERALDLIALDEALTRLTTIDPQQGRIVEMRFFGGLSIEETAQALDISVATVKRDWTLAKAWLRLEVTKNADD
ncbi:MAG: sigma-70 family RNA polymerase sigma factor [Phycisphaerales bacterium]|nr:sigma-70 family RNA polymerase sigma factor [Phycisphaerales bacterium]MCI0631415.1 sigma-70 family RNA polymerase sigma factor [Phycisphaerales bacterium]